MTPNWRKVEDAKGFPYYLNESANVKQWDHPKFADLKQRIDDCNYVKYSTYRVALKIRVLQQALYMDEIPLTVIAGVFERHKLGANESSLCLESCDLEAVLSDIYFAANKMNHTNTDIDFATELMLNFLYNVYDKDRQGSIQVCSTKVALAFLSKCTMHELYRFVFSLCSDHNNCVTRLRLQAMLSRIVELTSFLHEDVNFGQHLVNYAIEHCFSKSPGLVGINECSFILWLEKGPQLLCWIPLLFRIKQAEPVVHSSKCTTCKITPLMGLRYKCIKCTRYNQCQRCFFTGRTSHSHKLTHPMREYFSQESKRDCSYSFMKGMCALLSCSSKMDDSKIPIITSGPPSMDKIFLLNNDSNNTLCDVEPLSSPQSQLHVIIRQLELQNKELHHILLLGSHNEKQIRHYLEEHRIHVAAQIEKLKVLKHYLNVPHAPPNKECKKNVVESTPLVQNGGCIRRPVGLELFSPIKQSPVCVQESGISDVSQRVEDTTKVRTVDEKTTVAYSMNDISTWINVPTTSTHDTNPGLRKKTIRESPVKEFHNELDEALARLQQILANNFSLDESLGTVDNSNLKYAVTEVEGMLTSIIDNVESSRASSAQPFSVNQETELLTGKV